MKGMLNLIFWGLVITLGAGSILNLQNVQKSSRPPQQATVSEIPELLRSDFNNSAHKDLPIAPIDEFYERITKKPFGIYITPQTSPVQPDRFEGYHTGVDIEYEGIVREIPVRAITSGKVILSKFASGYGGVIILRHNINDEDLFVLYGHLDPKSMLPQRTQVTKGQIIGFLGEGRTEETDGARKHLHFAMLKKNSLDIRGYAQNKEELEGWYDPLEFYKN